MFPASIPRLTCLRVDDRDDKRTPSVLGAEGVRSLGHLSRHTRGTWVVRLLEHPREALHDIDNSGPDDDDEEHRQDAKHEREQNLDR